MPTNITINVTPNGIFKVVNGTQEDKPLNAGVNPDDTFSIDLSDQKDAVITVKFDEAYRGTRAKEGQQPPHFVLKSQAQPLFAFGQDTLPSLQANLSPYRLASYDINGDGLSDCQFQYLSPEEAAVKSRLRK